MGRVNVEALEAHVDAQLADLRGALLERPDRLGRGEAMAFVRAAYGRAYLHRFGAPQDGFGCRLGWLRAAGAGAVGAGDPGRRPGESGGRVTYVPPPNDVRPTDVTAPTTIVVHALKENPRPVGFAPWPEPPKPKRVRKPKAPA